MFRLALTYGSVAAAGSAAYLGIFRAETATALGCAVLAAVLVGARLELDGMLPRPRGRTVRRVGAVALALALVATAATSGIGGELSPTGTAAADWSQECDIGDSLFGAAYNTIIGADSGCRWESGDSVDYENITATDQYSRALGVQDSTDSYVTQTGNFMEDSRTVAYSKGKISLINDLNNGTPVSEAKAAANDTVEDYYAQVQANIVADYNSKAAQWEYMMGGGVVSVSTNTGTSQTIGSSGSGMEEIGYWENQTYTLVNGSTRNVSVFWSESAGRYWAPSFVDVSKNDLNMDAIGPESGDVITAVPYNAHGGLLEAASAQSAQVQANLAPYADSVFAEYTAGELNATDLARLDPSVIAAEASTDLNSTGYYSFAAIQIAAIGGQGDLNVSHSVEVYDDSTSTAANASWNGTLFYTGDDAPEGWNTSERYNISDYGGTFYFVVSPEDTNKSAYVVDMAQHGSEFTLTSATNTQTGESVNSTQTQKYVYDSTNASELAEEIDRLEELREQYENANTGGAGGIGFDLGGTQTGFMLALVLVVFFLTRD